MHEYNPSTSSAHLEFIPVSATGPGMTFSQSFPSLCLCFRLLSLSQPFLSPAMLCPSPRRLHLSSQHPPQKGEQTAAALSIPGSYILQVLTRAPLTEPPPHWAIPGLIFPVCVQRPEERNQLPAASSPQKLPWGKSAPHRGLALEVSPGIGLKMGLTVFL